MPSTAFRRLLLTTVILILASCASNDKGSGNSVSTQEVVETEQEKTFREIIEGFPLVELPIEIDEYGTEASKYRPLINDKTSQFADEFFQKSLVNFWARVYPSDKFHYLIGSIPADIVIPIIYVFDKNGREVDRHIVVSEFGSGPEGNGKSVGLVRADKSFTKIDSLFYHTYIEELDSIVSGSGICTAVVSEYRILSNGMIEMFKSDTVKTKIKD
jgi:hypothetical protein